MKTFKTEGKTFKSELKNVQACLIEIHGSYRF